MSRDLRKAAVGLLQRPRIGLELFLLLLVLAAAVRYAGQVAAVPALMRDYPTDFRIMFQGAEAVRSHLQPYDLDGLRRAPFEASYIYPPLFAALLSRFTPLGFLRVAAGWLFLTQLFYFASLLLSLRVLRVPLRSILFYAILLLWLVFGPTNDSQRGGQLDCLLLFLLVLSWAGVSRGRDRLAGPPLALAAALKVYPGLLALAFLACRRWRALGWFTGSFLGLMALSILLAGWNSHAVFLTGVLPLISHGTAWIENQSIFAFLARLAVNGLAVDPATWTPMPAATWGGLAGSAGLLAAALVYGARWRDARLLFVTLIALDLLVIPNAWIHYETVLLLPVMALTNVLLGGSRRTVPGLGLLWASTALLALPAVAWVHPTSGLLQSYRFAAILLIALIGIFLLRSESPAASTP